MHPIIRFDRARDNWIKDARGLLRELKSRAQRRPQAALHLYVVSHFLQSRFGCDLNQNRATRTVAIRQPSSP